MLVQMVIRALPMIYSIFLYARAVIQALQTLIEMVLLRILKPNLMLWVILLKSKNHGFLPPFQPGKCSTCHRGGTLPFIDEADSQTLENAYLNYKLILHDRSFGIHNPGYAERLLQDSIDAIHCACEGNFDNDQDQDGSDAATFKLDFGRSSFFGPCTDGDPCNGDFDCDVDVDGTDAAGSKKILAGVNSPTPVLRVLKIPGVPIHRSYNSLPVMNKALQQKC